MKEISKFDPFDGLEVTFSGIAPNGTANISGMSTSGPASVLRYSADRMDGLSEGDVITIMISGYNGEDPAATCAENFGMVPSTLTKEYTVDGLDSYVSSLADISDESLGEMQAERDGRN